MNTSIIKASAFHGAETRDSKLKMESTSTSGSFSRLPKIISLKRSSDYSQDAASPPPLQIFSLPNQALRTANKQKVARRRYRYDSSASCGKVLHWLYRCVYGTPKNANQLQSFPLFKFAFWLILLSWLLLAMTFYFLIPNPKYVKYGAIVPESNPKDVSRSSNVAGIKYEESESNEGGATTFNHLDTQGEETVDNLKRRLQEEEVNYATAEEVTEDNVELLDDDIHFHPGQLEGERREVTEGGALLDSTFLRAPEWSTQERYNEAGYSSYFYIRDESNLSLTSQELNNVKSNIGIYRTAIGESDSNGNATESDGTDNDSGEQKAYEQAMKLKLMPKGVYVMCYCSDSSEILERCSQAYTTWGAEGIYIQVHDNLNSGLPFGEDWYENIDKLKKLYPLKVSGLYFGAPNWTQLGEIIDKYNTNDTNVFDSITVMWDDRLVQDNKDIKCMSSLRGVEEIQQSRLIPVKYFAINENPDSCKTSFDYSSVYDKYVNDKELRDIEIPSHIEPMFPCYGDYVGGCFRAITQYAHIACDASKQRYVFSPYQQTSNRILHLYNEVCIGLGINLPPHDVVQALL